MKLKKSVLTTKVRWNKIEREKKPILKLHFTDHSAGINQPAGKSVLIQIYGYFCASESSIENIRGKFYYAPNEKGFF